MTSTSPAPLPSPTMVEDKDFDSFKKSSRVTSHNQQYVPLIPPSYISPAGLAHLKAYKYRSGLSGYLDRVIMTPFWEWVVLFMPSYLAPNLITTISLLSASLAYQLLASYTPDLTGSPPPWAFFTAAFFMFAYQTLDAIDGKQARRTGSSSPLGQLFDHGCDAICAVFHGLFLSSTIGGGNSVLSLLTLYFAIIPFYVSNWEEASTHYMRFGVIGVTEAQLSSISVLIATGILGPSIWDYRPLDLFTMRTLFVLVGTFGLVYQCVSSIFYVVGFLSKPGSSPIDRRLSAISIAQFIAFIVVSTLVVLSPSPLYGENPRLVLWVIGLLSGYQVSRLIICHVTTDPHPLVTWVLVPLPVLCAAMWWRGGEAVGVEWVWGYLAFIVVLYVHFIYVTINQITRYLGIHCFHIKPRIIQSTSGPVAEPQ